MGSVWVIRNFRNIWVDDISWENAIACLLNSEVNYKLLEAGGTSLNFKPQFKNGLTLSATFRLKKRLSVDVLEAT